nr:uncharacterized mitochondrial protein AtMg00810-like [Tanacetum cinerariifolium]
FDLKGYSDSDYAGCNMDRKTTSGACQLLGGKLVCWSAKNQQSVAMSLAKAEYVAVAGCCANILWIKSQLIDYDIIYEKFHRRPTAKGVGLRVADSHTSNHPEDGFTLLETIRRLLVVIKRRSYSGFEGEAFEPERRVRHQAPQLNVMYTSMGSAVVPKALFKPITHLENWKDSFFFIENKIIPSDYPELLLGENKLDKKSFKDKVPLHPDMDPLYDQIAIPKRHVIYHRGRDEQTLIGPSLPPHPEASKKLKILSNRKVASGVPGKDLPPKVQKVPARASKVAGKVSTPLDVDSDSNIHEFPLAKELRDATDCHWVVAHVTPPFWKQHLREISIEKLCDIHDRAY